MSGRISAKRGSGTRLVGQQKGEVNLGSGQAISVLDVANLLVEIFDADESLIEYSSIDSQGKNSGFSPIDITRARNWFNYQPTTLRDGLLRWFVTGEL